MKDLFLEKIDELKESGKTEREIARYFRMSTMDFRRLKVKSLKKKNDKIREEIEKMKQDGLTIHEIAIKLGIMAHDVKCYSSMA